MSMKCGNLVVHGGRRGDRRARSVASRVGALRLVCGLCLVHGGWSAGAETGNSTASEPLPEVVVIGTTPLPGLRIDIDKMPGNIQSLSAAELVQDGAASLAGALGSRLGSVNINDALADPFQPDILYRGFEASPVVGTPQGMAIYQNGVRINEAFGDTVNWDLIPDIAINHIDIMSANPLYGLNALGGAMAVTMKNGFTYHGAEAELSGGSFAQRSGSAQIGFQRGVFGLYAAARASNQDGWRLFAHDAVHQYYASLGIHTDATAIDLSYSHAENRLFGQGAAPVQSLAINRESVFTGPQDNINGVDFITLEATHDLSRTLAVQSVAYVRNFRQSVANGNTTEFTACTAAASQGALCQADGLTPLVTAAGAAVPDISNGGANFIGENDSEWIHSQGRGASLQLTSSHAVGGFSNQFAAGASMDTARVDFSSAIAVGVIDSSLVVLPGPHIDTPEDSGFTATPVSLRAADKHTGWYATDTIDLTTLLAVSASGRYNVARIDLSDLRGANLSGNNRFSHFNPALGLTYKLTASVTAFAGYSTNTRAPTVSEIECSDALRPCLLPSSLSADPPTLKQVIAHTLELGLRGHLPDSTAQPPEAQAGGLAQPQPPAQPTDPAHVSWNLGAFRTDVDDDIYGVATSTSSGYFQNIGSTRRQGVEAGITYQALHGSAYVQYSLIDATFQSPLTLRSPSNPHQDVNGRIEVKPGDQLPGIPHHRIKAGAEYSIRSDWTLGCSLTWVSSQYYHGDESNQNPTMPGYHVVGLRSSYRVGKQFEIFASVQNLFDARYSNYGLYGNPTGAGAPGIPADAESNDPRVDNRFQSPAAPRAVFAGMRMTF